MSVLGTAVGIRLFIFAWTAFVQRDTWKGFSEYVNLWVRWDALHYLTIARHGYSLAHLPVKDREFIEHFPPVYPLITAAFHFVSRIPYPVAGILVSVLAFSLASLILWKLAFHEFGSRRGAYLAVLYLNLFPTSYFANSPYAEGVYICLVALYFYLLRVRVCYGFSSITLSLLLLTKTIAVVLLPVHGWVFLKRLKGKAAKLADFIFLALPVIFLLGYEFGYKTFFHMANYLTTQKEPYGLPFSHTWPYREAVTSLFRLFREPSLFANNFFMMTTGWESIFFVFVIAVTIHGINKIPAEYSTYSLTFIGFLSLFSWVISGPRYCLSLIPVFLPLAGIKNRPFHAAMISLFGVGLLCFSRLFAMGEWAF